MWQFVHGVGSIERVSSSGSTWVGVLVDLMFCQMSFWCPRIVWAFLVQSCLVFSTVRLGNPVSHPFSTALRKVACVGDPNDKWCMFTCSALVLVFPLYAPPVLFTSSFVKPLGHWTGRVPPL